MKTILKTNFFTYTIAFTFIIIEHLCDESRDLYKRTFHDEKVELILLTLFR